MSIIFVAEVSSNHNQDLNRCFEFIDKSAEIGCDAVKFQLFKVRELFAPEILAHSEEHLRREEWELPVEFLPELATRCHEVGIQFGCTPFYLDAVDELFPHVDFYKIASYELLWKDLLVACARTGKPVVLSTGMATIGEVKAGVDEIKSAGCKDLTLLHCVSGYPTPIAECNLAAIETLKKTFRIPQYSPSEIHVNEKRRVFHPGNFQIRIGWSDHSVSPAVICRAIHRWGAEIVEFHLDLDGKGEEYASGHCWLPDEIGQVIQTTRFGFQADGTGEKTPTPSELADRDWRADPGDGFRPVLKTRVEWKKRIALRNVYD